MSEKDKKHYVRVCYAADHPSALRMTGMLNQQGIDACVQGGVKDIYKIGGDICGEEIMVDPEDLLRAREVLGQFTNQDPPPLPKRASIKRTALSLIAAAILLVILLLLRGQFL